MDTGLPDRGRFARPPGQLPRLYGHRGASALATENTLAAFRRAVADGADGVELDVQCCRSGEVVVFHDDDLGRLAGRPERIDALPLSTLRELVLPADGRIPTLLEAFDACGESALVNVELKYAGLLPGPVTALVDGVAADIARVGASGRVVVSSFSPAAVWLWKRRVPQVPCALLFERPRMLHRPWPLRSDCVLPVLRPMAVHPAHDLCSPAGVDRWRRRGYLVNVWTVDDPARLRALAAMGVDGIITNDPGKARAVLTSTL
jgi:glycerophosphoryl diester phosphodiesterase